MMHMTQRVAWRRPRALLNRRSRAGAGGARSVFGGVRSVFGGVLSAFGRRSMASLTLVCAFGLAACSPTFDWRELRLSGFPAAFMFPAKPAQMSREVTLGEYRLTMSMAGARRGELIFTHLEREKANNGAHIFGFILVSPRRAECDVGRKSCFTHTRTTRQNK